MKQPEAERYYKIPSIEGSRVICGVGFVVIIIALAC